MRFGLGFLCFYRAGKAVRMSIFPPVDFTKDLGIADSGLDALQALNPLVFNPLTSTMAVKTASNVAMGVVSLANQELKGVKTFMTGAKSMALASASEDLVTKGFVDDAITKNISWHQEVQGFADLSITNDQDPGYIDPSTLTTGDRYIALTPSIGHAFTANYIYQYESVGPSWSEIVPVEGWTLYCRGGSIHADETITYNQLGTWVNNGNSMQHQALIGAGTVLHSALDVVAGYVNQDVKTTASPAFNAISTNVAYGAFVPYSQGVAKTRFNSGPVNGAINYGVYYNGSSYVYDDDPITGSTIVSRIYIGSGIISLHIAPNSVNTPPVKLWDITNNGMSLYKGSDNTVKATWSIDTTGLSLSVLNVATVLDFLNQGNFQTTSAYKGFMPYSSANAKSHFHDTSASAVLSYGAAFTGATWTYDSGFAGKASVFSAQDGLLSGWVATANSGQPAKIWAIGTDMTLYCSTNVGRYCSFSVDGSSNLAITTSNGGVVAFGTDVTTNASYKGFSPYSTASGKSHFLDCVGGLMLSFGCTYDGSYHLDTGFTGKPCAVTMSDGMYNFMMARTAGSVANMDRIMAIMPGGSYFYCPQDISKYWIQAVDSAGNGTVNPVNAACTMSFGGRLAAVGTLGAPAGTEYVNAGTSNAAWALVTSYAAGFMGILTVTRGDSGLTKFLIYAHPTSFQVKRIDEIGGYSARLLLCKQGSTLSIFVKSPSVLAYGYRWEPMWTPMTVAVWTQVRFQLHR